MTGLPYPIPVNAISISPLSHIMSAFTIPRKDLVKSEDETFLLVPVIKLAYYL